MRHLALTRDALLITLATLVAALLLVLAGCGGDDSSAGSGNSTDSSFASTMIPHHEGAIEMAEIATTKARHPELEALADDIISTQQDEIVVLRRISEDLEADGVELGHMGMSAREMGMDGDMPMLRSAKNFDDRFTAMMIAHHRGAVIMARKELANGEHEELRKLAEDVVAAQTREIEQMQAWRKEWGYGAVEDAGSMGHGSMMDGE